MEIDAIKALVDADQIVIACGGGGIPVIEQKHVLKGASAVIEKDAIAGKLAADLQTDMLLILTNVDYVYESYGKEDQKPIESMNIEQAKKYIEAGEFGEENMLPKIEAAIEYLSARKDGKVIITSITKAGEAVKGKIGTVITA